MKRFIPFVIAVFLVGAVTPAWGDTSVAKNDVTGQTIPTTGDVVVEIIGRHNVTIEFATENVAKSYQLCFASHNGNYGRPGSTCPLKGARTSWARSPSEARWRMP